MANKNNSGKKKKDLKKKIYRVSMDLFMERGFDNVKVIDICKELDISPGTFYYYYPSKESIFFGYTDASNELFESVQPFKGSNYEETLKNIIMFKLRSSVKGGPDLNRNSYLAIVKHSDDTPFRFDLKAYGLIMNTIEDGIRAGEFRDDVNFIAVTNIVRYILIGLVLHWSLLGESLDIEAEGERLFNTLVGLLKPPKAH